MMEVLLNVAADWWPIVSTAIAVASIVIRLIPELPANHWAKPYVKFLGKYVAINRPREGQIQIVIKDKDVS
jgi:hypothetical protein